MEEKPSKRKESERRDAILVGVLVVICIALFGVGSFFSTQIRDLAFSLQSSDAPDSTAKKTKPTPKPTNTPVPTPTPKPTPTPQSPAEAAQNNGLGVTYAQIQSTYETSGFSFEKINLKNETERYMGKSSNGVAAVQIAGPAQNISKAVIIAFLARDNPELLDKNLKYMTQMIQLIAPDWEKGNAWFYASLGKLAGQKTEPRQETTVYNNIQILLKLASSPDLIFLSFEPVSQ